MSAPALETRALCVRFGGLIAANDVSLKLEQGARHALIGPNGAGKTTLVNLLSGVLRPSSGAVLLAGEDVTALSASGRARRGLARTFQINQLFADMTPAEHICLAGGERRGAGADWRGVAGADPAAAEEIAALLGRFDLIEALDRPARQLAYGQQRLLEIALALAQRPRTLLLDEPAAGVPAGERAGILAALAGLPADVTVLLIEHDMDLVFRYATRISVLVGGRLLMEGAPAEVAADARVREAYLGTNGHG
jgi:branched-chain amino acid transport system ATP-binding protein